MREILFRGKRIDDGEWVEGWFEMYPFGRWPVKASIIPAELAIHGEYGHEEVDPNTVGQCTGLTDKNGKKIFEGDIVQFRTRSSSFKPLYVRWYKETASFIVTESNCVRSYPMDNSWEYEVLGNIHDDIELLKGGAENE